MGGKKLQRKCHRSRRNRSKSQNKDQGLGTVVHYHNENVLKKDLISHFDGVSFPNQTSEGSYCNKHKNVVCCCNNAISRKLNSSTQCRLSCTNSIRTISRTAQKGLELAVYDPTFARDQIVQHSGTCVVCKKHDYFMKTCSRCHVMKYCSHECLRQHCKNDRQKVICVRNILFTNARKYIPPEIKQFILSIGCKEISHHLYTIPTREIYLMMGGSRTVVLLQVFSVNFNQLHHAIHFLVQDIDGNITLLQFQPPPESNNSNFNAWFQKLQAMLPAKTFILLFNAHWNVHADKASAAVHIANLQQIFALQHTDEIFESVTSKDEKCLEREFTKFGSEWESNVTIQQRT